MLTSAEIRQKYLDFFRARGHTVIPSSSLIPDGDSTLLFTNSGMFPLVPYLLGEPHPGGVRLTDSQKSFRTGDIEEVGDHRHTTFFEMLGNWSLGDYFKREQLAWWYEFLVREMRLDPRRLYQTVYAGSEVAPKDEESVAILREVFETYGIEAKEGVETLGKGDAGPGVAVDFEGGERIFAYRDKNWWQRGDAVGELGGPDSETFYDTGKSHDPAFGPHCHLNCDCGRFLEIGNSVFMQYQKTSDGWRELPKKNVDFGGGLERITMVVQGRENVFETDLFAPILEKLTELSGRTYHDETQAFEIIADHLKAATFILGDRRGVAPSNVGQGYVVRRLIRRAARYARRIGIEGNDWSSEVARIVIEMYRKHYPELEDRRAFIIAELSAEEERFGAVLERGLREFEKVARGTISGEDAFNLFQTYGFPIEMTEELARERGDTVDRADFASALEKHRRESRTASSGMFRGGLADQSEKTTKLHTATHLLLAALRRVLGAHVSQKGSNITAERLRLDFPNPEKVSDEQIAAVERIVNEAIHADLPIVWQEVSLDEARAMGAVGVFGERYGERVKVYRIGEGDATVSLEICGGPHVARTGELGRCRILKEEAVSAGLRRIRADLE